MGWSVSFPALSGLAAQLANSPLLILDPILLDDVWLRVGTSLQAFLTASFDTRNSVLLHGVQLAINKENRGKLVCPSASGAVSKRIVPLVGDSLWATQQVTATQQGYCFPGYARDGYCNGNSASAALGKWMKNFCEAGATVHGIRHAFRDRLRAVNAPVDLIDQLGGWSAKSVGISYGDGYDLQSAHNRLAQLATHG